MPFRIFHICHLPVNENWQQHEILLGSLAFAIHSLLWLILEFDIWLDVLYHSLAISFSIFSLSFSIFPLTSCPAFHSHLFARNDLVVNFRTSNCKTRVNWILYIYILISTPHFSWCAWFLVHVKWSYFSIQRKHSYINEYKFYCCVQPELETEYFLSTSHHFLSYAPLHNITPKFMCRCAYFQFENCEINNMQYSKKSNSSSNSSIGTDTWKHDNEFNQTAKRHFSCAMQFSTWTTIHINQNR